MSKTDTEPELNDSAGDPPRSFGRRFGSFTKEVLIVVVGAIIVSSLLRAFVGQMFLIPSGSMENTLLINDRVVVQKITDFKRGDVVVFADPGGWLGNAPKDPPNVVERGLEFIGVLPNSSTEYLIKRAIGMPGDHVVCCDDNGRITVNGQPLDEQAYLYTNPDGSQVAPSDFDFDIVVPAGRIFVMGDHRDDSADSRCHLTDQAPGQPDGAVAFPPLDLVVGPAIVVALPIGRATVLSTPGTFEAVPPPTEPAPAEAVITNTDAPC